MSAGNPCKQPGQGFENHIPCSAQLCSSRGLSLFGDFRGDTNERGHPWCTAWSQLVLKNCSSPGTVWALRVTVEVRLALPFCLSLPDSGRQHWCLSRRWHRHSVHCPCLQRTEKVSRKPRSVPRTVGVTHGGGLWQSPQPVQTQLPCPLTPEPTSSPQGFM